MSETSQLPPSKHAPQGASKRENPKAAHAQSESALPVGALPLTASEVIQLQRLVGNHVVQQMVRARSTSSQIQRAIAPHVVSEAGNNQTPLARRAWLGNLVKAELSRLLDIDINNYTAAMEALKIDGKRSHLYWNYVDPLKEYAGTLNLANPITEDHIYAINLQLNQLEVAVKKAQAAPAAIAQTFIGNEFTFVNNQLAGFEPNSEEEMYSLMETPYNTIVAQWKAAMSNKGKQPSAESTHKKLNYLTYTFLSAQHGLNWNYQVTPDQLCVEIITSKATGEDIHTGIVGNLMDEYIFKIATGLGLYAHAKIGGGHINIDEKTSFGTTNNVEEQRRTALVLLRFMQDFYAKTAYWEGLDPDVKNAPFPKDIGTEEVFKQIVVQYNTKRWTVTQLADVLMQNVFTKSLVGEQKKKAAHYQALNIEHLGSDEVGETRRLEVRRVPAQPNRSALITQLSEIAKSLEYARLTD